MRLCCHRSTAVGVARACRDLMSAGLRRRVPGIANDVGPRLCMSTSKTLNASPLTIRVDLDSG